MNVIFICIGLLVCIGLVLLNNCLLSGIMLMKFL